jgi:ABC-2 type transport system permease protein
MNFYAIGAIYRFEMARFWRTMMQSIASPVLSTSLYFIVFGTAIGPRMMEIDGVSYGAFIVPGLIMLSVLTESISNASFGIYMVVTPLAFLGGSFYSIGMLPPFWQKVALFNPVVYLVSGFRWSFYGVSDVNIAVSLAMTLVILAACLALVWWIFKTGYRLKA